MKYHIHVTSKDSLGMNMIENIIELANMGATLKEGTLPAMRFPHSVSMVLESDTPPTPSAVMRVFEYDTNKEIFPVFVAPVAATFSVDSEKVDKSTNSGTPWTKDQLEAMDWDTEFKVVMADAGIDGKRRAKMTSDYIAKYSN